jgi:hypothetical protein
VQGNYGIGDDASTRFEVRFDAEGNTSIARAADAALLAAQDDGTLAWTEATEATAAWRIAYTGHGHFAALDVCSGQALTVGSDALARGVAVTLAPYEQRPSQQWRFIPLAM